MKKNKTSILVDIILAILLVGCSIGGLYFSYHTGLIPDKWLYIATAIIVCIDLILILLMLKKLPRWVVYVKRFFIIVLCILLALVGVYMSKFETSMKRVSTTTVDKDGNVTIKSNLYVVTAKEGKYHDIKDLENTLIGFQNGSDSNHEAILQDKISQDINYEIYEGMDYTTLYYELLNNRIQAIAMSEEYYNMSKANISDFADKSEVVKTYEYEITSKEKPKKDITKEVFTVYLSGLDNLGSPDQQTRTDTNLILIVDPIANHIDMVSLPRDGYMPNTATNYVNDKLTHTGIYGVNTSIATLENFFGIDIDYFARVSFNSLIQIVDTIGGIDVDVEIDFCEQDENRSFAKDDLICLTAGKQHLNGKQALAYSRHRKTIGYDNPGRERAQQRVIRGIINRLLSLNAITYVYDLLEIAPNYVATDMPYNQITSFVKSELANIQPWTISSISSDNGVYDSQYVASISQSEGKKDVYLFTQEEVQILLNALDGASKMMELDSFSFDFNNLYENCPAVNDDPSIVWDTMANNPH